MFRRPWPLDPIFVRARSQRVRPSVPADSALAQPHHAPAVVSLALFGSAFFWAGASLGVMAAMK